jgi:hypothetical protein
MESCLLYEMGSKLRGYAKLTVDLL